MAEKLSFFLSEWQACDPDSFAAREANPETVLETISRVRPNDVKEASAAPPLAGAASAARTRPSVHGSVAAAAQVSAPRTRWSAKAARQA